MKTQKNQEKILLVLLPFWTPLTPPLGILSLKSFLQEKGYTVKAKDATVEKELKEYSHQYVEQLKESIPQEKRGNFYSIVQEVLRNHLMVQVNSQDHRKSVQLLKTIVSKTFFYELSEENLEKLDHILQEYFQKLEKYVEALLEEEKPTVFGLSVFSDTLASSIFAFKLAKQKYPEILTVMGGGVFADLLSEGSPNYENFLKKTVPYIDKIIIGEGEHLLLDLLEGKFPDHQRVFTLEDIQGKTMDITTSPSLDLTDFNLVNYPYMVSYTSRSCPFQCKFCSETVQWGNYRKKSVTQVYEEMKRLYHQYHTPLFLLSDSLLNPVITGLASHFEASDLALYWEGWLRADKPVCDVDNTYNWRRGGFYHARIGAESGSPRILELMGKKITPQQIKDAIFSLSYVGIKTTTLWIVGYPGETEEDFQQTLNLIEELKDDIYEAEGTPFWYFLKGQANSEEWGENYKSILLYPSEAKEQLMTQTWILDCEPSREIIYDRLNRFVGHLGKLGIPNTYSLRDIYKADDRWTKLHKNAVPPLVELKNSDTYIDECKHVKKVSLIRETQLECRDFGF
jgi:radical SAM superfamily enzyme YgiQ (UPF0313 family)